MENLSDYVKEIIGLITAIISLIGVTISLITVLIVYRKEPKEKKQKPKNIINISIYNIKKIILLESYDSKKQSLDPSTIYAEGEYKKILGSVKTKLCQVIPGNTFKKTLFVDCNHILILFKKVIDSNILEKNINMGFKSLPEL